MGLVSKWQTRDTIFAWFHTITSLYLLYVFSWSITAAAEMVYLAKCYREQVAGMK